jgi:serine/threonine protein kinase
LSISKSNFVKVKLHFADLVNANAEEQALRIKQLLESGELNDHQAGLLKDMLVADKDNEMLSQVQSISGELLEQGDDFDEQMPGKQIGSYVIIKKIGAGGMGQVYLAERNDGQFDQQVAIKVSHSHLTDELIKRFETERQILSDLNHPNIARLLDGGTGSNGEPYLVMELIDGQSIDQYCVNTKPDLDTRINLILQACDAIKMAHQNLILHRDLKPDNIMVTQSGQVKIVDFGIAKLLEPIDASAPQTATQVMTRYYASPEQIKGQHVSTQSDLFSLAIIAYELITGCHPFINNETENSQHQREVNVLSGDIMYIAKRDQIDKPLFPELTQIPNSKIEGDLENVLRKALFNDLNHRYQSVDAFATDLRNFLANKPVSARKPSFFYNIKKLIQRQKVAAAAVLMTALSLIAATGFSIWKAEEALQQKRLADQQRQLAEIESEKAKQIADFVKMMLQKANPQSSEKQVTAQDLLYQGFVDANETVFVHQETKYELLALIHQGLGSLGKYQESLEIISEHHQECVQQLTQSHQSCQTLLKVKATIETTINMDKQALETLDLAEKISLNKKPLDREELFDFYAIRNGALLHLGRSKEAYALQQKMLDIELKAENTNPQRMVQITHNIALYHIINKQFDQARDYIDSIPEQLEKYDSTELPMWLGAHYGLEAFFYSAQNLAQNSFEFRKKRVDLMRDSFEVLPNKFGNYLRSAGDMAIRSGLATTALEYYLESFNHYKQFISSSERNQYHLLLKISLVHLTQNQLSQAKKRLAQAERYSDEVKNKSSSYQMMNKIIKVYIQTMEGAVDENVINQVCQTPKFNYHCHTIRAIYAINTEQWQKATELINEMDDVAKSHPNDYITSKHKIAELKSRLESATDNH